MTTGALIFAFDNEKTDYVSMAAWSAKRIHRHLGIPTAVITDVDSQDLRLAHVDQVIYAQPNSGGTRYFDDHRSTVTWYNAGRANAYQLTPWEQTLVLDADYVVCSTKLRQLFDRPQEFMCHRHAWDMSNICDFEDLNCFGHNRMPMWWATVMLFRKSNTAQYIFDCMHMVQTNWGHYRNLYHITDTNYRNDHALSIALGIVSGHTLAVDNIPWNLASVVPMHELTQQTADGFSIEYLDQDNRPRNMGWVGMDFHAMGKKYLGDIVANSI